MILMPTKVEAAEAQEKALASTGNQQGKVHRFKPGQSGNPRGRKKGSKNVYSEDFLRAYAADFKKHGAAVIAEVRETDPLGWLKIGEKLASRRDQLEAAMTINITQNNAGVSDIDSFSRSYHELLSHVRGTKLLEHNE